jgi:hypothetical protein
MFIELIQIAAYSCYINFSRVKVNFKIFMVRNVTYSYFVPFLSYLYLPIRKMSLYYGYELLTTFTKVLLQIYLSFMNV